MTIDPNAQFSSQPDGQPAARDLRADLAAVIATADGPQQAAEAVLGVLRDVGRAAVRPITLADFLTATAAHLREHGQLGEVAVTESGVLHLRGLEDGQEGWALAEWADSLGVGLRLSRWRPDPPGAAKAQVFGTFRSPSGPIGVEVWDVVAGAAELLGEHQQVEVSTDQLRAWLAARAAGSPGGGERS